MYKEIKFISDDETVLDAVEKPAPASSLIPDWYKKSYSFKDSNTPSYSLDGSESTIKGCMPVLDSMSIGYIQKTWTDIHISIFNNKVEIICSGYPEIIHAREPWNKQKMPSIPGHIDTLFAWSRPWGIVLPKGYSVIMTHPMYHLDLPFTSLYGIIDADKYHADGTRSVPFFIKDGFSGIIPKGTPMYQIIPFKREKWKSIKEKNEKTIFSQKNMINSVFNGFYKKNFWTRKEFL